MTIIDTLKKKSHPTVRLIEAGEGNNRISVAMPRGVGKFDAAVNGIWLNGVLLIIQKITPDDAQTILDEAEEANANIRNLNRGASAKMQRAMLEGRFSFPSSNLIMFDINGLCVDGQTRLTSVARSGKAQVFVCAYFVDNTIHVDTGTKRTAQQVFRKRTGENLPAATSLARIILIEKKTGSPFIGLSQGHGWDIFAPDYEEQVELAEGSGIVQKCARAAKAQKVAKSSPFAYVYWAAIVQSEQPQKAEEFFGPISTGEVYPRTMQQVVYNRLLEYKARRDFDMSPQDQAAFMIKAWNCFLQGRYIERLNIRPKSAGGRKGRWTAESFPRVLRPGEY